MTTDLSKIKNASDFQMQHETPEGLAEQFRDYKEYKSSLDFEIKANAEGFVRIGYLLKVARDTDILSESGYKSVAEFAQAEYGLTKDVVSRFIAINDRYSVDGYSEKLLEKYEGYGVAKLQEMLTLPDEVIEEIKPSLTKREIIDIKKEIAEEEKITPVEIAIEAAAPAAVKDEKDYTPTERIWKEFFHENRELYKALGKDLTFMAMYTETFAEIERQGLDEKAAKALIDILAPNGDAVLFSRIPGVGKIMISVHSDDGTITYTNTRTNEKTKARATDAERDIHEVFGACDAHEWELIYGEPLEKQESPKIESQSPKIETQSPINGTHKAKKANDAAKRQQDDGQKAAKEEVKPVQPEDIGMNPPSEESKENLRKVEDADPKIMEYKTRELRGITDVKSGDKLVNLKTGEIVDVIGQTIGCIKCATDHGIILVDAPNYVGWVILEDENADVEADRQQDTEDQEDESVRGLRQRIFDKEHELEEVFEDAYADGLTMDGLLSIRRLAHQLQVMVDKMIGWRKLELGESEGDEE